jgi:DUF1680 family protein
MYCLESIDNGDNLSALTLDVEAGFDTRPAPEPLPGAVAIVAKGWRRTEHDWSGAPYRVAGALPNSGNAVELVAVPYHLWGNRGPGEMTVWMRRHGPGRSSC